MPRATKPFQRSQQCSDHQTENIGRIPPWTCSLSSPNPVRNQRKRGSGKSKLIGKTWSRLAPRTCSAPGREHLPGQLSSGKTASCRELAPPHARRWAAIWQSTGPTHSCWSRRRVFGRTPQLQGVPRKTINPQNAVSSTATVAHKTVRVLQLARMKQGDALKTLKCSLRTNARNVQRPPTVSNPRPERRVRCATFSQRWHKWHERIGLRIAAQNQA